MHDSGDDERHRAGAWIAQALAHGDKVVIKQRLNPGAEQSVLGELPRAAVSARQSGQLEIIDAKRCYADTGGDPRALLDWHLALVQRAREEGYSGVSMTGDGAALHVMVPDPEQLMTHERDLDRLTAEARVRALCRYDVHREQPKLLSQLAEVHYHSVEDLIWTSEERIDKLVIRGEIDISNTERFAAVLYAAIADSLRVVDLTAVTFMSVAATAALARIAQLLRDHGDQLVLVNVPSVVMRMFSVLDFAARTGVEVIPAQKQLKNDPRVLLQTSRLKNQPKAAVLSNAGACRWSRQP